MPPKKSTGVRKVKRTATKKQLDAAKSNPWLKFMEKFRPKHPEWKHDAQKMLQEGSAEYRRSKK